MPDICHDTMDVDERYKLIRNLHWKYEKSTKKERSQILDTTEEATKLTRKYIITLFNRVGPLRRSRTKQRGRSYGAQVDDAIRVVARALDWCCAERLQPVLAETAAHLGRLGVISTTPELLEQLHKISVSSVERILKRVRQYEPRLPQRRGKPTPGTRIQREIPINRIAWDEQVPGHFEIDTVQHSGPVAKGDYVCTLQWVDVATVERTSSHYGAK